MKLAIQDSIWKESYIMNKRVQAFLDKMQEKELDGIIINNLKNVYYWQDFGVQMGQSLSVVTVRS